MSFSDQPDTSETILGTIAEPTVLLSARRVRLPPPRARSPIKTSLGSSPRRSLGLPLPSSRSSDQFQHIPNLQSPHIARVSSEPDAEISIEGRSQDAVASPSNAVVARKRGRKSRHEAQRGKKRAFELSDEEGMDQAPAGSNVNGLESENAQREPSRNGLRSSPIVPQKATASASMAPEGDVTPPRAAAPPVKGKRGRPRKQAKNTHAHDARLGDPVEPQLNLGNARSNPSRNAKNQQHDVLSETKENEHPAPRRARKRLKADTSEPPTSSPKRPPPSERDPNATVTSRKGGEKKGPARLQKRKQPASTIKSTARKDLLKEAPNVGPTASSTNPLQAHANSQARPKQRSLFMLRSETPQDIAKFTRSGRTSVKPVAYWRNEKIVYGESKTDGQRLSLPGIKEVIRTDEIERQRPRATRKKSSRRNVDSRLSEDSEELDEWEKGPGNLFGEVLAWEPYGETEAQQVEQIGEQLTWGPKTARTNEEQKWQWLPKASRSSSRTSRIRTSNMPRPLRCPFSIPVWSSCLLAGRNGSRTRARITWCSGFLRAGLKSPSTARPSPLERAGCGRSLGVGQLSFPFPTPSFADSTRQFLRPREPA